MQYVLDIPGISYAGLIAVANQTGTTMVMQNHGTANKLKGSAVPIITENVLISDNIINFYDNDYTYVAFYVDAKSGFFAHNRTDRFNYCTSNQITCHENWKLVHYPSSLRTMIPEEQFLVD